MGWVIWVIAGGSILIVLTVLFALIGCVCAKMITTPAKPSKEELIQRQIDCDGVDFKVYDAYDKEDFLLFSQGIELRGTIVKNPVPSEKWVIIAHGFTASRINSIKYVNVFLQLGFNCLTYDQRYFGESGGAFCSMGFLEMQDLVNIINFVKEKYGENLFLALHGESMGAVTALCALDYTDKVDCVIADCAFSDAKKYFAHRAKEATHLPTSFPVLQFIRMRIKNKYKFDLFKVSAIKAVEKTNLPILFIHGVSDDFTSRDNSIEMYEKCKNSLSRIFLVPDADHACSYRTDPEKYTNAISDFLYEIDKTRSEQKEKNQ